MSRRVASAVVGVLLLLANAVLALEVPFLAGRVTDNAGILSAEAEERISDKLEAFETRTGSQVAVLTIPSLEGEVLEEYSLKVAETWGLGRQDVDDGVLLLIAKNDRKMRIEVGYGLEPDLTDAEAGRILRNVLRPRFQSGDFDGGVETGVDTILATLEGADVIPPDESGDLLSEDASPVSRVFAFFFFFMIVGIFAFTALFSRGAGSWVLYLFLMPFWLAFPAALVHPWVGVVLVVLWILLFPLFRYWMNKTKAGKSWSKRNSSWTTWTSGSGSSWSSGGGGFSGGGGSFGGGGASGGW